MSHRKIFEIGAILALSAALGACSRHDSWTTRSGLRVTEIVEGQGASPAKGEIVSIHYTAWYVGGKEFEDTRKNGEPVRFLMGKSQLLPGLEEGVSTMRKGGRQILVLPPDLAFGKEGRPPVVPPDTWVKFDVELVDIEPGPPRILPWNDAGMEVVRTSSGLQYVDFEEGTGEYPSIGSTVVVNYTGFLEDGTVFDSSYDSGSPWEFEVSPEHLIPGWLEGLLTMREGGKRKLIVPPFLAYGKSGFAKAIPPDATLIYDVELLDVRP